MCLFFVSSPVYAATCVDHNAELQKDTGHVASGWAFAVGPSNSYWLTRKEWKATSLAARWNGRLAEADACHCREVDQEALVQHVSLLCNAKPLELHRQPGVDRSPSLQWRAGSGEGKRRRVLHTAVSITRFIVTGIRGWPPPPPPSLPHTYTPTPTPASAPNDHLSAFNAPVEFTRAQMVACRF